MPLDLPLDYMEALAAGHEQAVVLAAVGAEIRTDLRQTDESNPFAVRPKDTRAAAAVANPSCSRPSISVDVDPDPVRKSGFALRFRGCEPPSIGQVFSGILRTFLRMERGHRN
jgi:hypothetical protein